MSSIANVLPIDVIHQIAAFLSSSLVLTCHRVCKTFCTHMVLTNLDEELICRIIINGYIERYRSQTSPIDLTSFPKNMPRFEAVTEVMLPGAIRLNFQPDESCRYYYSCEFGLNLYCELVSQRVIIVYDIKNGQCDAFMYCNGIPMEADAICQCQVSRTFATNPKIHNRRVLVKFVFGSNLLRINEYIDPKPSLGDCNPQSTKTNKNCPLYLRIYPRPPIGKAIVSQIK